MWPVTMTDSEIEDEEYDWVATPKQTGESLDLKAKTSDGQGSLYLGKHPNNEESNIKEENANSSEIPQPDHRRIEIEEPRVEPSSN